VAFGPLCNGQTIDRRLPDRGAELNEVNEHQQHLYRLLHQAGEALRAFQLYEIGRGHGDVANAVNNSVTVALTEVFNAQRKMGG
jgi:hypothetical protein